MKIPAIFLAAILYSATTFAQEEKIEIPSGVNYKYAKESVNAKSVEAIKTSLTPGATPTITGTILFCGPLLWTRYEQIPELKNVEGGNVTFNVPQYENGKVKKVEKRTGKMMQSEEDFKKLWAQVVKDFEGTEYTIRKLKPEELSYYWSIISFDITEPIYIVDNGTLRILMNFSAKEPEELLWIEQMP